MAAKVDANQAEIPRELLLALEEAGMGHQAVEQQQGPPLALVRIRNLSAVRCREELQTTPPPPPFSRGLAERLLVRI
jgi:hypothetical protein